MSSSFETELPTPNQSGAAFLRPFFQMPRQLMGGTVPLNTPRVFELSNEISTSNPCSPSRAE